MSRTEDAPIAVGSFLREVLDISLQLSEAFEGRQGHSCKLG